MKKSAINRNKIEEGIIKILEKSNQPLSTEEIAKNMKKSWHTIIRYCLDLELKGKVFKFTIGRINVWQIKS